MASFESTEISTIYDAVNISTIYAVADASIIYEASNKSEVYGAADVDVDKTGEGVLLYYSDGSPVLDKEGVHIRVKSS